MLALAGEVPVVAAEAAFAPAALLQGATRGSLAAEASIRSRTRPRMPPGRRSWKMPVSSPLLCGVMPCLVLVNSDAYGPLWFPVPGACGMTPPLARDDSVGWAPPASSVIPGSAQADIRESSHVRRSLRILAGGAPRDVKEPSERGRRNAAICFYEAAFRRPRAVLCRAPGGDITSAGLRFHPRLSRCRAIVARDWRLRSSTISVAAAEGRPCMLCQRRQPRSKAPASQASLASRRRCNGKQRRLNRAPILPRFRRSAAASLGWARMRGSMGRRGGRG